VPVSNSLNLLTAMRAASRPVEAHLFQEGGHAFASGYPNSPTASWIAVFDACSLDSGPARSAIPSLPFRAPSLSLPAWSSGISRTSWRSPSSCSSPPSP
jgi:hypothetical protein